MAAINISNSTRNCSLTEDFNMVLPVTYSVVLVVGLLLNLIAMYAILFRIKHWSPNTIYMLNLTVCDTVYILTLPFLIYYHLTEKYWPFTEAFCKIIRFLFYTNLYGSILFLSCINVHRYIVICHPVRSLGWVNPRRARYVSILVWAVVLIFQAPVLYFSQNKKKNGCSDTTTEELFKHYLPYTSVISVIFFLIPFVLVIVCNSLMVQKLIQPSTVGGAISQRSRQKSVKMIVIVMLVFIVCFVPFHFTRSLNFTFRYLKVNCKLLDGSRIAYKISRPLASINSCIDPILYFMAGQGFRRTLPKKIKQDQRTEEYKVVLNSQSD
ncbi:P2Y purinoceptor 2-like [Tachysurus fulvidraco]|uniref:P2Y purinoceptor 2-like n=1 Tax=Tachysurus fulvidraco TaxID=1234273 RepID=UPI001FEFB884|nr:P2Y purinoceptor 2-like [Tachysurus fulvidraco]